MLEFKIMKFDLFLALTSFLLVCSAANQLDYRFTNQLASTAGLNLCRVF
jgi:hypothetical protein